MEYNYEEVIHIIQNTRRFGTLTGYEVSKRMLEQLGNPHKDIPFVHIAGTNGKGSTTAFLCEILKQAGIRVGMFTSPHLITFEERIRINGTYIPKEDVTRLGNQLLKMEFDVSPTMFDYCLCMAVLYFKEQNCDLMVMETGIGGRFDSTNALGIPLVSVITKIGFDHMAILGNTLEEIAYEKAGIIKKGVPVVLQKQEESARNVICDYVWNINNSYISEYLIEVSQEIRDYVSQFPRKMLGNFQIENAASALLTAIYILGSEKFKKPDINTNICVGRNDLPKELHKLPQKYVENIKQGIAQTIWKGRMELVNENPFFMIDGAHNPDGVHALAESLKALYPNEKFHFIMAVMADKDYENMIEELIPLAHDFVTITPEYNRALQAKELAECIAKKGITATYAEKLEDVIVPLLPKKSNVMDSKLQNETCCKNMQETESNNRNGKTVAFGSLYFIGEIEALL